MQNYKEVKLDAFTVVGIAVRTINKDGKSQKDISELWNQFMYGQIAAYVPHKESDDVYCIYTDYDSNFMGEYTTILGYKVSSAANLPDGLVVKEIPVSDYRVYTCEGKIPECVGRTWMHIWEQPDTDRAYKADFEVYGPESQDQGEEKVFTYLSVK